MARGTIALLIEASTADQDAYSQIALGLCRQLDAAGRPAIIIRTARRAGPKTARLRGHRLYSAGDRASLSAIFDRHRVALAHMHFAGKDHWGFQPLAEAGGTPYVLTFHNFSQELLGSRHPGYEPQLEALMDRAAAVTAVSSACRNDIVRRYPRLADAVKVVENGADPGDIPRRRDRVLRKPFLLSVGDLSWEKGTDVLLFALRALLDRGVDVPPVVLCGKDQTEGQMRGLIKKLGMDTRVTALGPRPHRQALRLMRDCLFYVCPSRNESFGIAVCEAMALGKAVLAPDAGGIPERVRHGRTGWLFEPGNSSALETGLLRLLRDAALRRRLGLATPTAARRWTWSRAARGYLKIYENILQPPN